MTLQVCDSPTCPGHEPGSTFTVATVKGNLCASCWRQAGCPPAPAVSLQQKTDAELATRDKMQARGGTDRHMVRSGKAGV